MTGRRRGGFILLWLILGTAALVLGAHGQEKPVRPGIGIRSLTPEEVLRRIQEEEAKINAEQPIPGLSRHLSYYLRKRFPDQQVLTRDDATEDHYRSATTELGQPSPFICLGDFDGDGFEDAAVVLRETATQKLIVMAFHQSTVVHHNPGDFTTREYNTQRIAEVGQVAPGTKLDNLLVKCHKPGQFTSAGGEVTLILKNHSIEVSQSYYGATLYYFVGDYKSLLMNEWD